MKGGHAAPVPLPEILPGMLAGPFVGAWLDRRDRLRWAIVADAVRAAALASARSETLAQLKRGCLAGPVLLAAG